MNLFGTPSNGAAEALLKARDQGKVRFLGFTGHKAPHIHLAMLETGFPFDAVQMPLNVFDATFRSFEQEVLPVLNKRGIAVLGMKPMTGKGEPLKKGAVTPDQLLRYAMSLPVTTTVTGMERLDVLRQNLGIAQGFKPMSTEEMEDVRNQCRTLAADGRFEHYKASLQFDNPQAREAHHFPIDPEQKEVKEMMLETVNTGRAYPETTS